MKSIQYVITGVIVIGVIGLFFVHTYTSSPGFVTQEMYADFEKNKKECLGFSYLLNGEAVVADAPGKSLCLGWLR